MEKYWEEKVPETSTKETWARLRCESVGKERAKSYKDMKRSMCEEKKETVAHQVAQQVRRDP